MDRGTFLLAEFDQRFLVALAGQQFGLQLQQLGRALI